jgi:hypothetical protein
VTSKDRGFENAGSGFLSDNTEQVNCRLSAKGCDIIHIHADQSILPSICIQLFSLKLCQNPDQVIQWCRRVHFRKLLYLTAATSCGIGKSPSGVPVTIRMLSTGQGRVELDVVPVPMA